MKNKRVISICISLGLIAIVGIVGYFNPMNNQLRLGDRALSSGNFAEAERLLQEALKANPENWDLKAKLAQTYIAEQDFTKADALLTALEQQDPIKGKLLIKDIVKAKLGVAKQQLAFSPYLSNSAIVQLEKALKYAPDDSELKQLLAAQYFWQSVYGFQTSSMQAAGVEQMQQKLQQAITLDPQPIYKVQMAVLYFLANQPEQCTKSISALSPEELKDDKAHRQLALLYTRMAFDATLREQNQASGITQALGKLDEGLKVLPADPILLREKIRLLVRQKANTEAKAVSDTPGLTAIDREILQDFLSAQEEHKFLALNKEVNVHQGFNFNAQVYSTNSGSVIAWGEANADQTSTLWTVDLNAGITAKRATVKGMIENIFITLKGQILYTVNTNGQGTDGLFLIQGSGSKLLFSLPGRLNPSLERISPDARFFTAGNGQNLQILEIAAALTGGQAPQVLCTIPNVYMVDWAPDSSRLLITQQSPGSPQNPEIQQITQLVVDPAGKELSRLKMPNGYVSNGFTPQAKLGVTYIGSGLWDKDQVVLGELDEQTGNPQAFLPMDIYSKTIGANFESLSFGRNMPFLVFNHVNYWSPDGSMLLCPGGTTLGQDAWIIVKGQAKPLPLAISGEFLGWTGNRTVLFAEYTQSGDGEPITRVTFMEYTINP